MSPARGRQFKTSHTIDNNETGLSMCGKLLPLHSNQDPTPWQMHEKGHVAHWDNDPYPPGYRQCSSCESAYRKRADDIDARKAKSAASSDWRW